MQKDALALKTPIKVLKINIYKLMFVLKFILILLLYTNIYGTLLLRIGEKMKENKETNILSIILVFGLLLTFFVYKYSNKVEYLCLKEDTYKDTKITKDMIKICASRGRAKEAYITKETDIIGKCLNTNKRKERLIYPKDIEICESDRNITPIELTEELKYYNHKESSQDKELYTTFYIKDNILYAKNDNQEEKLLFNQEKLSKIASRSLSYTGDSRILLLTEKGNVYISEKDPSYDFDSNENFYFWKLEASNIVGFELINDKEGIHTSELYGITKDKSTVRIEEEYK